MHLDLCDIENLSIVLPPPQHAFKKKTPNALNSFALSLLAWISDAPIFSTPQCLPTIDLFSTFPRIQDLSEEYSGQDFLPELVESR